MCVALFAFRQTNKKFLGRSFCYFKISQFLAGVENLALGEHCTSVYECFHWPSRLWNSHCQVFLCPLHVSLVGHSESGIILKSSSFLAWAFPCFSHFSLLLGCALPKWMSSGFNDRPLGPFPGILSLGIGDTMVSFSWQFVGLFLLPLSLSSFHVIALLALGIGG